MDKFTEAYNTEARLLRDTLETQIRSAIVARDHAENRLALMVRIQELISQNRFTVGELKSLRMLF